MDFHDQKNSETFFADTLTIFLECWSKYRGGDLVLLFFLLNVVTIITSVRLKICSFPAKIFSGAVIICKGILLCSVSDPVFSPDPDQTFSESGSGSAKNPDPIRKNPDTDP